MKNIDTYKTTAATGVEDYEPVTGRLDSEMLSGVSALEGAVQSQKPLTGHSLSVILPAYNEEQAIARTVHEILLVQKEWQVDCEIIVVDDGSSDRTALVVKEILAVAPQVRLISHASNQGYGAALLSGFAAATRDLTFFMDADGQFDIRDLRAFFPYIETYDAVIGYRIARQDTWMRRFNAWGWKQLVRLMLGVSARDIDCAFKLLPTAFLQQNPLETRGAMVNAELFYQLKHHGLTWKELGVHHLPRRTGQATGAKPGVILRALYELGQYAYKWRWVEQRNIVLQK
jgi:glycosyltransferase involved in cell wall biosynthesis